MNSRQKGFIDFGTMTLVVGGIALAGLLLYGAQSGQELPFWPAIAVTLVNLVAAGKMVLDVKKRRQEKMNSPTNASPSKAKRR